VDTDQTPTKTGLQLLARVQFRGADGDSRECFGNIMQLGPRTMRLESGRPLMAGRHLLVQVVFPGQRHYPRPHVPLHYVVRAAHDEANLHYDLEVTVLDKESYDRLLEYLRSDRVDRPEVH
jgi:hypothetical protein